MSSKRAEQPNWQAIFRKYSWWHDNKNDRHFVIVGRNWVREGELESVELLEERQEWPQTVPLAKMINYFNKELLVTVSVMADSMDLEIVLKS